MSDDKREAEKTPKRQRTPSVNIWRFGGIWRFVLTSGLFLPACPNKAVYYQTPDADAIKVEIYMPLFLAFATARLLRATSLSGSACRTVSYSLIASVYIFSPR